jgi:SulP family sulfate permease
MAQGFANLGSIFFGGIPATAAIARTATNIKSGAQTPIAGMIHAITIFLVMILFAPIVGHIPLAALAAVLVVVAWNMSEAQHFYQLLKAPRSDVLILLAAFLLTVLVDLTVAVEVGMILAAFLFMKRMGDMQHVIAFKRKHPEHGIEVYEMKGPFFFGVADRLKDIFLQLEAPPKIFVLRMKHVPVLDATGIHALREFYRRCQSENTRLVLTEVQAEPLALLNKFGLSEIVGDNSIFPQA